MLLYLSYRRHDRERVMAIASALENMGISVWWDGLLKPGDAFERQLASKLSEADVIVLLLTQNSTSAVQQLREYEIAKQTGKQILPVALDSLRQEIFPFARELQWLPLANVTDPATIASMIAVNAKPAVQGATHQVDSRSVVGIAEAAREHADEQPTSPGAAHAVFVVHGHDDGMKNEVSDYIRSVGVTPVILKELDTSHPTLFNKFEAVGREAKYAVVLISSDDFGTSLIDYKDATAGGPGALEYRARQNVILELGFFFGKLGWDNVFILEKDPPSVRPRFEMPSDLRGVVTRNFDEQGGWKQRLLEQLRAKGLAR
jgi:predicted nucleotide-binding protein